MRLNKAIFFSLKLRVHGIKRSDWRSIVKLVWDLHIWNEEKDDYDLNS